MRRNYHLKFSGLYHANEWKDPIVALSPSDYRETLVTRINDLRQLLLKISCYSQSSYRSYTAILTTSAETVPVPVSSSYVLDVQEVSKKPFIKVVRTSGRSK